jgi:small subunit ribosomal protein S3
VGQKTHPIGLRLGIIKDWNSKWFADKDEYKQFLHEDLLVRKFIKKKLEHAAIASVGIERTANKVTVIIHTARPGIIIGKKGSEVETLKRKLQTMIDRDVYIKIQEVRRADLNAQLVAENVGTQLIRRVAFRRAMKKAVQNAMKLGAQGIRISCSGRLGGAEMARREWYREGRVPLHTLRADIDYGYHQTRTTYGAIGVKVWIYHGDVSTN